MSYTKIVSKIRNISSSQECCHTNDTYISNDLRKIVLVGHPNVGKSALFNELTNSYVTVSNYPGTTIGISKAKIKIEEKDYEVIDTPGMYSLLSITEEEKISRKIIFSEDRQIIIHVIDAKNLERMLPLTLQLIEINLPIILVLNLSDELQKYNVKINVQDLEKNLNIPVIESVATKGKGIDLLKSAIRNFKNPLFNKISIDYGKNIEQKISAVAKIIADKKHNHIRSKSLLMLQENVDFIALTDKQKSKIGSIKKNNTSKLPFIYDIALKRQKKATEITTQVMSNSQTQKVSFADKLNEYMINPWTGIPILFFVVYVGLYQIVGKFGSGIAVDFIENTIFKNYLNPFFVRIVSYFIPWTIIQDLFIGEYGILTLGVRYAFAIILPIVGTFFFVFAIIEDSGYLPRLAMLIDRLFKKIGLSGRAVIPIVLGLGCSTMATMVTRTLPTKRERIIATLLLALAIPCSAQLGVLFTLLVNYPKGLIIWLTLVSFIFLLVGYLGAKIIPGNPPIFFMEVPPLRLPSFSNILTKTYTRIIWYLKEVFPLFIVASIFLWVGKITGIFNFLVIGLSYPLKILGLPEKTAAAYILGFFRRDFGAAGLYDMQKAGLFSLNQLTIAIITMTLLPACIAQALMMIKERGQKTGIAIFVFCVGTAFATGALLNFVFNIFKISL